LRGRRWRGDEQIEIVKIAGCTREFRLELTHRINLGVICMRPFSLSRVSGAPVSDEDLIADLRRVAENISRPTVRQKQYRQLGKYAHTTLTNRFGSWNKANIAAGFGAYDKSTSTELIVADLRRVATIISQSTVSLRQYVQLGNHDRFTVINRFGSWKKALASAGLGISKNAGIPDEILFENILRLWQHYGRQPRRSELTMPPQRSQEDRIGDALVAGQML
jgi:hypothetical protein